MLYRLLTLSPVSARAPERRCARRMLGVTAVTVGTDKSSISDPAQ